jgi:aryl-alcohol dehydrogenase-like predicted oxidoreductase
MRQVREVMARALELGVTLLDTADIYGQGDSEREIGRLLRGRREAAFVVTKFGKTFSWKLALARPAKPVLKRLVGARAARRAVAARRGGEMGEAFVPDRLARALESSLRRLRTDHVDAVLLHSPPAAALADPRLGEALTTAKASGKARHVGVSCDDRPALQAALALAAPVSLLELPVDLIDQAAADGLMDQVRARRIAVLAREAVRLRPDLSPLDAVAAAAASPHVDCVVVSTSRLDHLEDLVRAVG